MKNPVQDVPLGQSDSILMKTFNNAPLKSRLLPEQGCEQ